MREAARKAPGLLRELAGPVGAFVSSRLTAEGGFAGRSESADLYYTVFALEALDALGEPVPADHIAPYLGRFGDGASLDLVHVACLARSWAALRPERPLSAEVREAVLLRIERFRSNDGAFHHERDQATGTAYASFLALGAYQDLERDLPHPERLCRAIDGLRSGDGAYGNGPGLPSGTTPVTAAAVTVLCHLGQHVDAAVGHWLLDRCRSAGGFLAAPGAPVPDMLSTATALHALWRLGVPADGIREPCLDFLDSLWDDRGGFRGTWADTTVDTEYTYYGLLALGHLF